MHGGWTRSTCCSPELDLLEGPLPLRCWLRGELLGRHWAAVFAVRRRRSAVGACGFLLLWLCLLFDTEMIDSWLMIAVAHAQRQQGSGGWSKQAEHKLAAAVDQALFLLAEGWPGWSGS